MDRTEREFYLRTWWPSIDSRWPILQQDEDSQILILGSESCVVSPLGSRGSGRTGQHREHKEIKLGSNSRAAKLSWLTSKQGFRSRGTSWAEVEYLTQTDPPLPLTYLDGVCDTDKVQCAVGKGLGLKTTVLRTSI